MAGRPLRSCCKSIPIALLLAIAMVSPVGVPLIANAEDAGRKPPVAAINGRPATLESSTPVDRRRVAPRSTSGRTDDRSKRSNGGSWLWGTAGIAVALALLGWASVASRKYLPNPVNEVRGLKVIGRTGLSPKHSVYLLRAGDRVLIVGTGPQGPPSLLGELDSGSSKSRPPTLTPAVSQPQRFDHRLGDDDA